MSLAPAKLYSITTERIYMSRHYMILYVYMQVLRLRVIWANWVNLTPGQLGTSHLCQSHNSTHRMQTKFCLKSQTCESGTQREFGTAWDRKSVEIFYFLRLSVDISTDTCAAWLGPSSCDAISLYNRQSCINMQITISPQFAFHTVFKEQNHPLDIGSKFNHLPLLFEFNAKCEILIR